LPQSAVVPSAEPETRGDWKRKLDAKTGKHYYVNLKTKKTTWDAKDTSFA
jgi:hypothetical protein